MRLVGNARARKIGFAPMPLEICPGRQIWERHRNREYLVFVDESFYHFFGFADEGGNFCHSAVGIPSDAYVRLQEALGPAVDAYRHQVQRSRGAVSTEIKFAEFRMLPLRFRAWFTRQVVDRLIGLGGFVAGFYTPTRGQVMERVRTNLLDQAGEVPHEHRALYEVARTELLAQFQGIGQARLITMLLATPAAAITNLLKSFNCTFRVRYDPRQEDEDQEVRRSVGEYMDGLMRLPDPFGHDGIYLGMDVDTRSQDDVGLQLADIVAGEVREFFRRNPESLIESATPRLITATSDEVLQQFERADGAMFKTGALNPMSAELAKKLRRTNRANLLSYYYPVLAAGMLTCVTVTGQERHLEIPTKTIFDLQD